MSHFYGSMQGARKEQTCCGTKQSSMSAHIRGWDLGAKVLLWHDEESNKDHLRISITGGGHNSDSIKTVYEGTSDDQH